MSRHSYPATSAGRPVLVVIGYDRALRGFYLLVERCDGPDGHMLYCNLDDPLLADCMGLPDSTDYFVVKLQALGLPLWRHVLDELHADQRGQIGNRDVWYDPLGQVVE